MALGTRLNPFSTLPGYGIDYWPKDAKIIQVDMNSDRIGLTKKVYSRNMWGCKNGFTTTAGKIIFYMQEILIEKKEKILIHQTKSAWLQKLSSSRS